MAIPIGRLNSWRGFAVVWSAVLLLCGLGAGALQVAGPPRHAAPSPEVALDATKAHGETPGAAGAVTPTHEVSAHEAAPHGVSQAIVAPIEAVRVPVVEMVHRVAAPDAALMELAPDFPPAQLPRVAADGRLARVAYAGPMLPVAAGVPRVALLMAGFGLSDRDSRAALDKLPGPVSFAVSAYALPQPELLEAARIAGHELLASIPMEPQSYPSNDEGGRSLLTGLSPRANHENLEWALSRTQGVVGATGAADGMRGERFADVSGAFDPVLEEISRRGLLYVDPRPGRGADRAGQPNRAVDLVLDEPFARADIESKLRELERIARERGTALGLAGPLRPVMIERVAEWIKTLPARGFVLVPVSSLVNPTLATKPAAIVDSAAPARR